MKWGLVAIAILLAGGIGFVAFSGSDSEETNQSTTTEQSTETVQEASNSSQERSTLNRLFARGENLECSYSYTDDSGNASNGMAYFSQERMFGDFTVTQADGMELQSYILKVDNNQYVWGKDASEGYKLDLSLVNADNETEFNNDEGPDQDEEYDFNCQSWAVDESKFEVPADVSFIDSSQFIQNIQQSVEQGAQLCASLEGEAQAACEQAIGAQ